MAINKRELGYLVNHALADADTTTLVAVAEIVLGKKVTVRNGRFVIHKSELLTAPVENPGKAPTGTVTPVTLQKGVTAAGLKVLKAFDMQPDDTFEVDQLGSNHLVLRSGIRPPQFARVVDKLTADGLLSFKTTHGGRMYARTEAGTAAARSDGFGKMKTR